MRKTMKKSTAKAKKNDTHFTVSPIVVMRTIFSVDFPSANS